MPTQSFTSAIQNPRVLGDADLFASLVQMASAHELLCLTEVSWANVPLPTRRIVPSLLLERIRIDPDHRFFTIAAALRPTGVLEEGYSMIGASLDALPALLAKSLVGNFHFCCAMALLPASKFEAMLVRLLLLDANYSTKEELLDQLLRARSAYPITLEALERLGQQVGNYRASLGPVWHMATHLPPTPLQQRFIRRLLAHNRHNYIPFLSNLNALTEEYWPMPWGELDMVPYFELIARAFSLPNHYHSLQPFKTQSTP